MNDLETRLTHLGAVPVRPVTGQQVAADLAAARSASRVRTARRASLGTVAVLGAAAVAVVGFGSVGTPTRSPQAASTASVPAGAVRLVAYDGEQKPGFTVTTVPDGYVLQGANQGVLAIAPADDRTPIDSFAHKLVVTVGAVSEEGAPQGTPVSINGHPGAIGTTTDGATTLEWIQGNRVVEIQQWRDIHLTDDQLVTFADGITVTSDAQLSHG